MKGDEIAGVQLQSSGASDSVNLKFAQITKQPADSQNRGTICTATQTELASIHKRLERLSSFILDG